MERLPDDLWLRIFKVGIDNRILDHVDICSLAITCHHFDRLTQESDLWVALLAQNSLSGVLSDQSLSKTLFKAEFEKKKEREREMEEMMDEVMEFVMWLDNNFLDEEDTCTEDGSTRGHTDVATEPSEHHSHTASEDTAHTNRSNRAFPNSFWAAVSTILLPKRHYQLGRTS